jgi:hypothetical protein
MKVKYLGDLNMDEIIVLTWINSVASGKWIILDLVERRFGLLCSL